MSDNGKITINSVSTAFNAIKRQPITVSSMKGFFYSREDLSKVMALIERFEKEDKPLIEAEELKQIRSDTESSLQETMKWESRTKVAETQVRELRASLEAAKKESAEIKQKSDVSLKELQSESASLKVKLNEAKAENERVKAQGRTPAAKFDSDFATKVADERAKTAAQVASLNNELSKVKSKEAQYKRETLETFNKLKGLEKRYEEEIAQLGRAKATLAAVEGMSDPPPPTVVIRSDILAGMLGQKGIQWVEKAVNTVHHDARDRAYNLMLAFKSGSKTKSLNGFFDLLELVFQWVKTSSNKARLAILPWLDEVTHDLANATLKSLGYYRVKLEALVGELRAKVKVGVVRATKFVESSYTETKSRARQFVDDVWFWAGASYRRLLRAPARRAKRWVVGKFKALSTWWHAPSVPEQMYTISRDKSPKGKERSDSFASKGERLGSQTPSSDGPWAKPTPSSKILFSAGDNGDKGAGVVPKPAIRMPRLISKKSSFKGASLDKLERAEGEADPSEDDTSSGSNDSELENLSPRPTNGGDDWS